MEPWLSGAYIKACFLRIIGHLPFAIVVMVLPGVLNASFMNHERLKGQIALSGPLPFGSAVAWWVAVRPAGRAAPEADATRVVHGDPRCVAGHVLVRRGRRRRAAANGPAAQTRRARRAIGTTHGLLVARTALQVQGQFLRERLSGETAPCAPKCFFLFVIETLQALVVGPISTDTEEYFVFILCSQVGV